jgi:hypothetical protein
MNEICCGCGTSKIDKTIFESFAESICYECKSIDVEGDFKTISKKEAVERFLLGEDILSTLKFQLKQNPRNAQWTHSKWCYSLSVYLRNLE